MINHKLNLALLMGGPSVEHRVSLSTGANILTALDIKKYNILPVVINTQGQWLFARNYLTDQKLSPAQAQQITQAQDFIPFSGLPALRHLKKQGPDIVFIALHGEYGEDGTIQRLLETGGLAYTGSGILASALGMDKPKSLKLFRQHQILIPDFISVDLNQWPDQKRHVLHQISQRFKYPLVVKPANRGSSLGVSIAQNLQGLHQGIENAFDASRTIMIQQYIKGREVTCGVLGQEPEVLALQPTEIIPLSNQFFNYQAKYTLGASQEITPPNLPNELIKAIQETALRTHTILNCQGMSRTDMIIDNQKQIYVLEINTIPGMTQTSLLPQAARAVGINFSTLLDRIINSALKK